MSFEPYHPEPPARPPRSQVGGVGPDKVVLMLFGLAIVASMGFVLGVALGCRGDDVLILALAMVTTVLSAVPLVIDQGRPYAERHVFMSILAVVFVAYFVLPALFIYIPATGPIDGSGLGTSAVMPPHVVTGQLVVLLGLVTLLVGYALPLGKVIGRQIRPAVYDWPAQTALLMGIGMVLLGWSINAGRVFGVIPASLGTGVVGTLANAETYAQVLLTYVAIRHRSRLAVVMLIANCIFGFLVGVVSSSKERMLINVAMIVLTWIIMTRRIRFSWVLAGIAALIMIYPVSQFVRLNKDAGIGSLAANPGRTIVAVAGFLAEADPRDYLLDGFHATATRTDGLGVVSVIVRDTPSLSPYQGGWTLGLFFVAFVPRALWAGKPNIQLGKWIAATYGSGRDEDEVFSYIAPTQIGEWYLNFGVAGVIAGMFLIAMVVRITQETLLKGRGTAPSIVASSVLLLLLGRKFQGSVAGAYSEIVFTLTPILLTHVAFRFMGHVVYTGDDPPPAAQQPVSEAQDPPAPGLTTPV